MIDEKTFETLSRYVDGDLQPDETAEFESKLAAAEELRSALGDILRLRKSLRTAALDEQPPAALDDMVRPLRRAGRPMPQRWAVAALVGAAAVLVVSVIVVSEVGRTGWTPWTGSSWKEDGKIFALSNPPSRDPEAPVGAIESLLAQDDPEPGLVELEPLEVMGPLDQPPGSDSSDLVLKIGTTQVPVSITEENEGLKVILTVEGERVTSCSPPEGVEPTLAAGDVCRQILSVAGLGLHDGQYEAVVVRVHEPGNPEPG
jgi:hypothetical protein